MQVGRLTGTDRAHRDERRRSPFIGSLRARASEQFRRGLEGNLFRLRRFLSVYTRDEIVASARLAGDGSGYLGIRCELEEALARTARGDPIIVGAEVSGTPSALDALKDDPRVAAFRSTSKWRTVPLPLDVPQPPARSACAKRPLPGAEVYRRIRQIVG